ncbi:MAG: adenylosuccinate synthase [Chloroflexi bacterium RBG_19FT_COMBO_48_23]|nr:MAG: adenylosuccinate synthase [Chloroflexi bacterium RBG_19FT_COMBO_48_23]
MSVTAIIGAQWGDEGKGKIVDLLATSAKAVVRFSGGDNAGHTVINPYGEFKLHIVPSGIFNAGAICIIGNGVAINPVILLEEIENLQKHGVDTSHLFISDRAHLIMPYHTLMDGLEEERRGKGAIGTTRKGIGPVFADKIARLGIRTCDLLNKKEFRSRLASILEPKNAILTKIYNAPPLSLEEIYEQYCSYGERLAPFIRDTGQIVRDMISQKQPIILEGAQGTMLDPDFGTYPYVTSSSPLAAAGSIGAGISPKQIDQIIGVFKAYTTRVGGGPMPTELKDKTGEFIRERAHEYGATTGRPRRCGWFDAVAGRFSAQINGFTGIALTRLDVLDALDSIKVCTGYQVEGNVLKAFPGDLAILGKCQPIYEELPGWRTETSTIRNIKQLPSQAQRYISRLEELLSCPMSIISVGANRHQTIMVEKVM